MSTYLQSQQHEQVISLNDLSGYFQAHAKPVSRHLLGLEWELFGNIKDTPMPLSYHGNAGIEAVLRQLQSQYGYQPVEEQGHVTALVKGRNYVALEPGGQVELSAEPVGTVHDIHDQLNQFRHELLGVAEKIPVTWFTAGFHPFARLDQTDWVPKRRYELMKDYLAQHGDKAHDMMKRTAANQVSVDYSDEADAMEKLRLIYGLTSLASALFSHSPLTEGQMNGFLTYRMHAWSRTDDARSGLIPFLLRENAGFEDYLDYALDVPMIFIIRENGWIPMRGMPFREFLTRGYNGFMATRDDFELHLSTLFPEARLKNCIEIRGADGQLFDMVPAVPAFWKGLLYDKISLLDAWKVVRDFTWEERCLFHRDMKKLGLRARLGKYIGWELIREVLAISRRGLNAQNRLDSSGRTEAVYLDSVDEKIIKTGKTPAEILITKWAHEFQRNPNKLLAYLSLK